MSGKTPRAAALDMDVVFSLHCGTRKCGVQVLGGTAILA